MLTLSLSVAKTADLIIMMLDATKRTEQRKLLEIELDAVGIRLNSHKPDIVFKNKVRCRSRERRAIRRHADGNFADGRWNHHQRDDEAHPDRRQDDPGDPSVIQK